MDPCLEAHLAARRQGQLDQQGVRAWEVREAALSHLEETLPLPCSDQALFEPRDVLAVLV